MRMYFWFLLALVFVFGVIFAYKNDFDPQLARHEGLMLLAEWRHDVGIKDEELDKAFDALLGEARETRDTLSEDASGDQQKWRADLDELVEEVKSKKYDIERVKNDVDGKVGDAKQSYEDAKQALENFRAALASIKSGMDGASDAIEGFRGILAE